MAGSYKNSIMLGIQLESKSDVQGKVDSLIKQINNSKITLDLELKDNNITKALENLNKILDVTKTKLGDGISLGNIDNAVNQTLGNVQKLNAELQNNSGVNNSKRLEQLQKEIELSNRLVEADQKRQAKDDSANVKAIQQENDLLAKQEQAYQQLNTLKSNGIINNSEISKLEQLAKSASSIKEINSVLSQIGKTTSRESSLSSLSKQIDDAQLKLEKMKQSFGSHLPEGFVQSTEAGINKLKEDLKSVDGNNFNGIKNGLNQINSDMKETTAQTKQLVSGLRETNSGSFFTGMSSFLASAGLFYGVAQAVQEVRTQLTNCFEQAQKLDSAFTDISITMNISKEQFADMSDKITQMGIAYGKSGNEVMSIAKTYANAQSSVDEVMAKVKPDLWLANVSRIDSADITKTIQSVNNQFGLMSKLGMDAEQATMKVGNSLVATSKNMQFDFVDGIKKITEAVKVGGSIAENAKMSLDDFISMTGAFVQQSGMSGEEFANSLKMISARVLQQKDLGESLGITEKDMKSAEKTLDRYNISIRDSGGQLRSLTDILKDSSVAFSKMTDSDRQYFARQMAGVNQSARFIDIMKSMNNQQLLYNATQTDTTALMDAQSKYSESLEGRIGSLKATYEGLMNQMMHSDTAKWLVSEATNFLNVLSQVDGKTIAFTATMGGLILVISKLVAINKELIAVTAGEGIATGLTKLVGVMTGMISLEGGVTGLAGAFQLLKGGIIGATESAIAFMFTPVGAVITALTLIVGGAIASFVSYKEHQADLEKQSKSLKDALDGVNKSLSEGDTKTAEKDVDQMRKAQEELQKYIEMKKKLQDAPATSFNPTAGGANQADIIDGVNKKIDEQIKVLEKAGMTVDSSTGKIQQLEEAEEKLANTKIVDSIKAQAKAQLENRENLTGAKQDLDNYTTSVQSLYGEYQTLSQQESLSAEQKTRLGEVVAGLQDHISNLNVKMDENGKAYISNEPLITDTIGYLDNEGLTINSLSQIRTQDAKATSTWQVNNTQVTYAEVVKRIQIYKAEIQAIQQMLALKAANASAGTEWAKINDDDSPELKSMKISSQGAELNSQYRDYEKDHPEFEQKRAELEALQKVQKLADDTYKNISIPNAPSKGGGYIEPNADTSGGKKGKGGKSDAEKEAEKAQKLKEEIDALKSDIKPDRYVDFNNALSDVNNELTANKTLQDSTASTSAEHSKALEQEVELYNKKKTALTNLNNEQKKDAEERKKKLEQYSFQFDADGKLINSEQRLLEIQKSINEETGDTEEAKKKKEDDIKWLKDLQTQTKEYVDLVNSKIPSVTNQFNELSNSIKKVYQDQLRKYFETQEKEGEIELEVKQKKKQNDLTKSVYGVSKSDWDKYVKSKKDQIKDEISDIKDRIEADKDDISAKDALKSKQEELKDLDKQSYKDIKDFQGTYEDIHNQRISAIDEEIKELEKKHDKEKEENELLEKKKELTKAQLELDKARDDKSVYSYTKRADGLWDFEWQSDPEAVKKAQDNVDKAKKDYDDYVKDQAYEKKKSDLEQQKTDEETALNTKKTIYDRQQKLLEESQALEKTTFQNHYSDMDKLVEKEMKDLATKYGDNWKLIYETIDKNLTDVEKRYENINKLKAEIGVQGMALGLTDSGKIKTKTDKNGNVISINNDDSTTSSKSGDILKVNETKEKEELNKYATALKQRLDTMKEYATKMIDAKADFESTILTIQDKSQDAQYNSLTAFAIKYTTFTDKFLEMLQLIYDFRYTNIVNLSTQMQDLIKSALLSCEEAYKDFVKMSSAMGIKVDSSVDISSALSQMEKYKQSVADWTKTKEDMYKNEKNNPLYNATSLSDYESKYNGKASIQTNNALYGYIDKNTASSFTNNIQDFANNIGNSIMDNVKSAISSFAVPSLNSSNIKTITNNKTTSSDTYYQIDKIEMTATDDPYATFNSIANIANQKASLKK